MVSVELFITYNHNLYSCTHSFHAGGSAHMDKYKKSIQKDLLQFIKEDPVKARILWQFKMDNDSAQTEYLPDDHQVTNGDALDNPAIHHQGLAIIVRDTEMHRAQQEEAKREQEIAKRGQEEAKRGQEEAKLGQEKYKNMSLEAQEKTKTVESQEQSKRIKFEFDMQFKTSKEREQTNRTTAIQNGLTLRATEKRKEIDAKARMESEKEQTKRNLELTKQKLIDFKMLRLQQGIREPAGDLDVAMDVENDVVQPPKAKRGRPRKH
jgi:hypothetical protein